MSAVTFPDDLLTDDEAAADLGVCTKTLARWRKTGGGPKYVQFPGSRLIKYRRGDLTDFKRASVREPGPQVRS
jgi:helix-turn-helix protein